MSPAFVRLLRDPEAEVRSAAAVKLTAFATMLVTLEPPTLGKPVPNLAP